MVVDYQARKNEVLASYETVEELVKALKDNAQKIGMPDPVERLNALLSDIRTKAEKVREDSFKIMVAGEANSGKSTFINAYIGVELLPIDANQCTSAIIHVKNGNEFIIRATYADERTREIKGEEAAREFLKKNAALDKEYQDIPVPTINNEILVKSGRRAKEKGMRIKIDKREVDDLLNAPEVQEANIGNLPVADYNNKICEYIEKKKDNWQDIVTEIEVLLPLSEEMRGIEIIDSPGVCARGGVAEISMNYIENADAIIFIKSLVGATLVSTAFHQFMRNASVERNKNALFLVLTQTANVTPADLKKLLQTAYHVFNNLEKSNILAVDSKAELYAKKLAAVDNIEEELLRLNREGTLDDFVRIAYYETNGPFGNGDKGDFIRALQERSRFSQVYTALEVFGRKAHYIMLDLLLDSICSLYFKLWNDLNIQMEMFREKAENPKELTVKINKVKAELDTINDMIFTGVDNLVHRFRGVDGIILKRTEEAVDDFVSQVSKIDSASEEAFEELERQSIRKVDAFKELMDELQREFVSECDHELTILSNKSTIPFISLKPDFTEETFREIRESSKSKAYIEEIEERKSSKKVRKHSVFSQEKYFSIVRDNIMERLDIIKNNLIDHMGDFVEKMRDRYIQELSRNADGKKKDLDVIMEKKAKADQIMEIVDGLDQLVRRIESARSIADKIKGGIEKNVQ